METTGEGRRKAPPLTKVGRGDDFVQPFVFHKLLEDAQGLRVFLQGAACRAEGVRWVREAGAPSTGA